MRTNAQLDVMEFIYGQITASELAQVKINEKIREEELKRQRNEQHFVGHQYGRAKERDLEQEKLRVDQLRAVLAVVDVNPAQLVVAEPCG